MTSIGNWAFGSCSGLTSITIPNSVTSIGESAFYGCSCLTSITIPNSVTSIGINVFGYCSGLTSIKVEGGNNTFDSRNNCNAIIETATNTLIAGCKSTVIPNSVTCIGYVAFNGCSGLTSITIPNSVTSIGESAFEGCRSLASVTIPNSVTYIGKDAFHVYKSLLVICNNENPPSSAWNAFSQDDMAIVPVNAVDKYKSAVGWNNMKINTGFRVTNTTQTTVTLVTHNLLSNQNVGLNNHTYYPANDTLKISGLSPNKTYRLNTYFVYGNQVFRDTLDAKTLPVSLYLNQTEATNLTVTVKGSYDAGDATITESGFEGVGAMDEYKQTGLIPNTQHSFTYYIKCSDGSKFTKTETFSTVPVSISAKALAKPTTCLLTGICDVIDATITDFGLTDYPNQLEVKLTGLDPETRYTKTFYLITEEGGRITTDASFTTKPLNFTALQPKVIFDGNVILAAQSNLDDEETNVGFEWRRTDWPDDFDSKSGIAYLYEGTMEGYIRSINSNYLWRFRPYYTSKAGNTYYGEWKGLDPSDYSYFEPTVHTYSTISVNGNSAEVKGYVMRGTDNVASQGFMYWPNNTSFSLRRKATSIPNNVTVVQASGNVMTATLEDLEYETSYSYVAFVKTSEGETFYGEQQSFRTSFDPDGIKDIEHSPLNIEEAWYSLDGKKLSKPQKGINIIRYSDGTSKKVVIK